METNLLGNINRVTAGKLLLFLLCTALQTKTPNVDATLVYFTRC
jgi:hypothetical protein